MAFGRIKGGIQVLGPNGRMRKLTASGCEPENDSNFNIDGDGQMETNL